MFSQNQYSYNIQKKSKIRNSQKLQLFSKNSNFNYENYLFLGPGLDPAFFTTAAFAPFLLLVFPFPAASSAFRLIDVLDVETPDEVKKLRIQIEKWKNGKKCDIKKKETL